MKENNFTTGAILRYTMRIGRTVGDWNAYVDYFLIRDNTIKALYTGDELRPDDKEHLREMDIEEWESYFIFGEVKDYTYIGNIYNHEENLSVIPEEVKELIKQLTGITL